MDIGEARKLKKEAEQQISLIIRELENQTGAIVHDCLIMNRAVNYMDKEQTTYLPASVRLLTILD